MNKQQKIILFSGIGVVAIIVALIVYVIMTPQETEPEQKEVPLLDATEQRDSLQNAYDQLELTNQFEQLEAQVEQFEGQEKYLKDDKIVKEYNDAKERINKLLGELNSEKSSNKQNREKIKQLEAEIATLKDIVRHYLQEMERLSNENAELRTQLQQSASRNEELTTQVQQTASRNEQLTNQVRVASKLNITALNLTAYNKKGKTEKNITKARQLGVSFSVAPNNTASAGMKTFAVRVLTPEGTLLGGQGSVSFDGQQVAVSAVKQAEYDNGELRMMIYVNVTATPTPGDYTVDVFCDGHRLGSRRFTMKK